MAIIEAIPILTMSMRLPAIALGYGEMLIVGVCALVLFGDHLPHIGRALWRSWHDDPNGFLTAVGLAALSLYVGIVFLLFGR